MARGFNETKKLLEKYNLPLVSSELFLSEKEALACSKKIKYPVVAKISSVKHIHKTEVNGVVTNIQNEKQLSLALKNLFKIKDIEGVLVQEQVKGFELIIGAKKDNVFGPVVMFGLGGIFVEIIKDFSFRIAPIKEKEALLMIKETKASKLMKNFRGLECIDEKMVVEIIVKTSELIAKEDVTEIDFNPVMAGKKVLICDAKII